MQRLSQVQRKFLNCHETKQRNFAFGWEELREATIN